MPHSNFSSSSVRKATARPALQEPQKSAMDKFTPSMSFDSRLDAVFRTSDLERPAYLPPRCSSRLGFNAPRLKMPVNAAKMRGGTGWAQGAGEGPLAPLTEEEDFTDVYLSDEDESLSEESSFEDADSSDLLFTRPRSPPQLSEASEGSSSEDSDALDLLFTHSPPQFPVRPSARPRYAHHGYSRSSFLHIKWFWDVRRAEWLDWEGRTSKAYAGIEIQPEGSYLLERAPWGEKEEGYFRQTQMTTRKMCKFYISDEQRDF